MVPCIVKFTFDLPSQGQGDPDLDRAHAAAIHGPDNLLADNN